MDKSEQFSKLYKNRFYFSFLITFLGLKHTSVDTKKNAYVFLIIFLHLPAFIEGNKHIPTNYVTIVFALA
jgi:hypothetical protein